MDQLAADYADGKGVSKDLAMWLHWERRAAEQGDLDAMTALGSWYLAGQRLPQDYSRAFFWLHKAADRGSRLAMCNLGLIYDTGRGVPVNHAEAYFWLDIAAASPPQGIESAGLTPDLLNERDAAASHLSPTTLAAVQQRAARWVDAHRVSSQH